MQYKLKIENESAKFNELRPSRDIALVPLLSRRHVTKILVSSKTA